MRVRASHVPRRLRSGLAVWALAFAALLILAGCDPEAREMARWQAEHDRIAEAMALPQGGDDAGPAETGAEDSAPEPDVPAAPEPEPEPAPPPQPEAAPPPDPPALVALRRDCARQGGTLQPRATGVLACVRTTGDGGRNCTASRQCEGDCLARSGTCAPLTPLYGCHEVLLAPNSRVTQCID